MMSTLSSTPTHELGGDLLRSNQPASFLMPDPLKDAISEMTSSVNRSSGRGRVFEVTNTNISGPGSFNQAIENANANPGHDRIIFSGSVFKDKTPDKIIVQYTPPIPYQSPAISDDVTIVGTGIDRLTLSGGNNYTSVLIIKEGAKVEISGVTITEGYGFQSIAGAGITNFGTLTLNEVAVTGNIGSSVAGGIANYGTLTLNRSIVSNNDASEHPGMVGGIYNEAIATINKSVISGNTGPAGGIWNGGGGGIYLDRYGTLTINNSTISDNQGSSWGGIHNDGGTTTINNSLIEGNSGFQGGGVSSYGFVDEKGKSQGSVSLSTSRILNNTAIGEGGGIVNSSASSFTLNQSTVAGNSAERGGGIYNEGIMTVKHSTIRNNSATLLGGGIFNFGSIDSPDDDFEPPPSGMEIRHSDIHNNWADIGGGIYNFAGILTVSDSTLKGNRAHEAGGIYNTGYYEEITFDDGSKIAYQGTAILTLVKTTIVQNQALSRNGGGVLNQPVQQGAISFSLVYVNHSTIKDNTAAWDGADAYGRFNSKGFNIIGDGSDSFGFIDGVKHDQVG